MNLLLLFFVITILIWIIYKKKENFSGLSSKDIQIVVSRYNEDLNWINSEPFNKYPIICYNKGPNNDFTINSEHKIIKLPNVGRCDHTYLYYIINNYDNLPKYTIFLPGSCDLDYKIKKSKFLIDKIEYYDKLVFIVNKFNNVKDNLYNFQLDNYKCLHHKNILMEPSGEIHKSEIRPFGKWYEHHFGDLPINFISFWGIFAISRDIILQHPKEYYIKFLKELEVSSNPEVGHYIERAWGAIFHPLKNVVFFDNSNYDYIYET